MKKGLLPESDFHGISERVWLWVSQIPEYAQILKILAEHSSYMAGGSVRDALLEPLAKPLDLDIVIQNDDQETVDRLTILCLRMRRNRHGNIRFWLTPTLHIDIIRPCQFYRPFDRPEDAIAFFDLSVNALGVPLRREDALLNPNGGLKDILNRRVKLTEARWNSMNDFESVHLLMRLLRFRKRYKLRILNPELALQHIPKLEHVAWEHIERLHNVSKSDAQKELTVFARDMGNQRNSE